MATWRKGLWNELQRTGAVCHWQGIDNYGAEATRTACGIYVTPTVLVSYDATSVVTCQRCIKYLERLDEQESKAHEVRKEEATMNTANKEELKNAADCLLDAERYLDGAERYGARWSSVAKTTDTVLRDEIELAGRNLHACALMMLRDSNAAIAKRLK